MDLLKLRTEFIKYYGETNEPIKIYFAPGRVNLIGEHTDYNGGKVFPVAINAGTYMLVRINNSRFIRFRSVNFKQSKDIKISEIKDRIGEAWTN